MWAMLEQVLTQGLGFILSIVLAHLLPPSDHGRVELVVIFITVSQILISSGLGQALVQKKSVDDLDFTMVFYLSLIVSAVLYLILFFAAPSIATFYRDESRCLILRVLSVTLIFFVINSVQNAEIARARRSRIMQGSLCFIIRGRRVSIVRCPRQIFLRRLRGWRHFCASC